MSYVLGESCIKCRASCGGLILISLCICELVKVRLWASIVFTELWKVHEAMNYKSYHLTLLICKIKTVLCCAKLL